MALKVHHSGLQGFKRCRRRWDLSSRQGWRALTESVKLWAGSAFHAGLKAFHATNPPNSKAFMPGVDAYFAKRLAADWDESPLELPEVRQLLVGMAVHYCKYWLRERDPLETLILDGEPQTEVPFSIQVHPDFPPFEGTLDRIVLTEGLIWVVEYKTAATFAVEKLIKDHQSTSYIWALHKTLGALGYEIGGVIYQQHRKRVPTAPEPLKRGGLTQNKAKLKNVPAYIYERELKRHDLPIDNYIDTLEVLRQADDYEADQFVRRDRVTRTPEELESFEEQVLLQLPEYCSLEVPIYPNFTNDCSWDCDYAVVCDVLQNRGDAEGVLTSLFTQERRSA